MPVSPSRRHVFKGDQVGGFCFQDRTVSEQRGKTRGESGKVYVGLQGANQQIVFRYLYQDGKQPASPSDPTSEYRQPRSLCAPRVIEGKTYV